MGVELTIKAGARGDTGRATGPLASVLRSIFRTARWRLALTYTLFNLENILRLVQPLVIGWAINDLLRSQWWGTGALVVQHLSHLAISTFRRMYDTRAFTGIYTDLATKLVCEQRASQVGVSQVAARSALSREFVDFFERDVPTLVRGLYSIGGGLLMLGLYDAILPPVALLLFIPCWFLNRRYVRTTQDLSGRLHDEFEREVEVIHQSNPEGVRAHYGRIGYWRIRLSDSEAMNFAAMEGFVLALIVVALVRCCTNQVLQTGDIFAVFRYVLMFVMGVDSVPRLVQQFGRLRDIARRMGSA